METLKEIHDLYFPLERRLLAFRCLDLKDYRMAANLTCLQLAAMVGVSGPHVSMIENGKARATPQYISEVYAAVENMKAYNGKAGTTTDAGNSDRNGKTNPLCRPRRRFP